MGNSEGVKIHNCHTSSAIFSTKDYVLHEDYLAIQQKLTASENREATLLEQIVKKNAQIAELEIQLSSADLAGNIGGEISCDIINELNDKNAKLEAKVEGLEKDRRMAIGRIKDMLIGDDGQAWNEAEKFMDYINKQGLQ